MIDKNKVESIRDPDRFNVKLESKDIDNAINEVVQKIKHNIIELGETFPSSCTVNNYYQTSRNVEWTTGFWTGILWLCYENTSDKVFRDLAEKNVQSFKDRIDNKVDVDNHDLGFMYIPSCVSAYKLTGNELAKGAALEAANQLASRFNQKGRFIQAWGKKGAQDNYRLIVDALMNIPLLHWATQVTGDKKFSEMANEHFETTLRYAIRANGSAYHTFFFDSSTGKPIGGKTRQGYSDDSSWARGQAWLIYGIPLNYRYLTNKENENNFVAVSNYFLNRLPKDFVAYWDLIFKDGDLQSRDSSSDAIAICGLNQMLENNPDITNANIYRNAEKAMLRSLIKNYQSQRNSGITPLIDHGVYSWHSGHGIDEGTIWGDYFYLEALTRLKKQWNPYW